MSHEVQRWRLHIRGVVQGVGFRPLVYRLACQLELGGFVRNEGGRVTLELEGCLSDLTDFQPLLRRSLPVHARIDECLLHGIEPLGETEFIIAASLQQGQGAHIPPDLASCPECLQEMLDPNDRRYGYPLLNCTACGPRYTVITALPYDRRHTTLRDFPLCADCQREYLDPANRRFHAQPTACAQCGPRMWASPSLPGQDPVELAREALWRGETVAVKGLGGYHLACRADLPQAVHDLRAAKQRPHRPLAVMVRDLEVARRWVQLDSLQADLLLSPARPILLVSALSDPGVLAPGQKQLGIMLPYTPIHQLLLQPPLESLVMTSGNLSGDPICIDNPECLRPFCSLILGHDRPIAVACEDSVVQCGPRGPLPLRRSRGYAPAAIALATSLSLPPLLAVGGELKSTLAMANGHHVWLSGHIGDVSNYASLQRLQATARHLQGLLGFAPQAVVADQHPGYLSRRWAEQQGLPLVLVQHHHAHVASLLAEHGWPADRPVLAFVFDGTGWGSDQTIWGGEVLLADYRGFQRLAYLQPTPLPGGEAAIRSPYRLALSYLQCANIELDPRLPCVAASSPMELRNLARIGGPLNSSMGRLFDAVSSLLGVCHQVSYEGQAACLLEAACDPQEEGTLPFELDGERIVWAEALHQLVQASLEGTPAAVLASRFHNGLADMVLRISRQYGKDLTVALSGGCFHNQRLLGAVVEKLERSGHAVLVHRQVPANDGGLALGQAVIAAHQI